jgi:chorismate mutase/prephenate dehydratase
MAVNQGFFTMNKLQEALAEVAKADEQLIELLNRRYQASKKAAECLKEQNLPLYDLSSQQQIMTHLQNINRGPMTPEILCSVYREIFSGTQQLIQPVKTAFLGPMRTFSHQATMEIFGSCTALLPQKTIPEVFRAVECGRADYGCVPIENSAEGVINYTMDWLVKSDVKITAEKYCRIHHCLMAGCKREEIRRIYSHPQVLGQCQHYLLENFAGVELVETASTAYAAEKAAAEEFAAALGSPVASRLHQLDILEENVEDSSSNTTRFLVIGKQSSPGSGNDKTSLCFVVKNRPGALYEALEPFRRNQLQMTLIESRPWQQLAGWEYCFFIDLIGHQTDPEVQDACRELEKESAFFKILGSYPRMG